MWYSLYCIVYNQPQPHNLLRRDAVGEEQADPRMSIDGQTLVCEEVEPNFTMCALSQEGLDEMKCQEGLIECNQDENHVLGMACEEVEPGHFRCGFLTNVLSFGLIVFCTLLRL